MIESITFGKNNSNTWIIIDSDSLKRDQEFYSNYGINEEIFNYALDKNERARMEFDELVEMFILIFNIPKLEKHDNHYETSPVTFLIQENRIITITNTDNQYIITHMKKVLAKNQVLTVYKFLFSCLAILSDLFFPCIETVDRERKLVNNELKLKTTKTYLLKLSDLEIGNVYLVSAAKQNALLLEQFQQNQIYRTLNKVEKEQLHDALIEAKQVLEMIQLTSQIIQQVSSTYNSILNNNLNDSMKLLTVLSVLLTVPTIITGFFGMNMPLPFEHNIFGWLAVIFISLIGWFGVAILLRKHLAK